MSNGSKSNVLGIIYIHSLESMSEENWYERSNQLKIVLLCLVKMILACWQWTPSIFRYWSDLWLPINWLSYPKFRVNNLWIDTVCCQNYCFFVGEYSMWSVWGVTTYLSTLKITPLDSYQITWYSISGNFFLWS